ncbi:MAG TPA: glutamate-ammonia-ligase adenylyltransferase [Thiolapillus brandeum]|uniref:Glutamate-ammonia-ligase adenylyltransferase n=1 Tax=Thiolapillus brandeum TaxID=1076588 RepID=A0A831KCS9_9GAMM|nr:glutamate-ammonia-ligase adenylyltransferase [Thiolapillus brandeum]
MDRGTKIYAAVLGVLMLGLLFLVLYESPKVSSLNDRLQADEQIKNFPYTFRVLRVEQGVAIMSTPRSSAVPVAKVLDKIFPGLGNSDPASPLFQELQEQLAHTQKRARELILKDPDIKQVQWELDRDWLIQHGVSLPPVIQ